MLRDKLDVFVARITVALGVCELASLVKLQESTKLQQPRTIQVCVPPFWLCLFDFIRSRSTGLKLWFVDFLNSRTWKTIVVAATCKLPYYMRNQYESLS